ncbi:Crp/Fnr family transcriptional regulator [Halioxenophilus sp. WMMB6]|uniref:Crp/Fnr family transcriptional regulator n=1 Tax=Halioxenophilus sp. WMMB6 TaxID=3073815 RepID=UPI00295E72B2|nr:cyclic nucleotide-binding domain-containing protein [Halioxenophilus sp. WMMB6]
MLFDDCTLFHDMTPDELERLSSFAEIKKFKAGDFLFFQNAPAGEVYNVISGSIEVERISCNGRRQILSFLFPGDFVGLTSSDRYDYGVKCLTDAELFQFNRKRLYALAEEVPNLKSNINQVSSKVFSRILDQLYILGQKKAHERLCFLFMLLLERQPGATPERITLSMSRQDMADYLGLTIETVSRSLAKLKSDGLITTPTLNSVQILDLDAIEELAHT